MPQTSVTVTFQGKDSGVVPLITKITEALQKMQSTASEAGSSVSKFMDDLAAKTKDASTSVDGLNKAVKDIGGSSAFKNLASDATKVKQAFTDAKSGGDEVVASFRVVENEANSASNAIIKVNTNWRQFYQDTKAQAIQPKALLTGPTAAGEDVTTIGKVIPPSLIQQAQTTATNIVKGFKDKFLSGLPKASEMGAAFDTMFSGIGAGAGKIGSLLAPVGAQVTSFISSTAGKIGNFLNPASLFKGAVSGVQSIFSGWQNAISNLTAGTSSNNVVVAGLANTYKTLASTMLGVTGVFSNFGASIRQVGQGLQTTGFLLSAMISVPVGAFLKEAVTGSVAFQDALVQVEIDSSLGADGIKQLSDAIRGISNEIPVSNEKLLQLADIYGKMGVSSVAAQTQLVESTAKLATATNEDTATIGTSYAKLGTIYFSNADDFAAASDKIGSTIVNLSRKNQVTAAEILKTSLNYAPLAKTLGIPFEEMLALSATIGSRSASAQRAGSQIGAGLTAMTKTKDIEKLAYALDTTKDNILSMERTNPAGFFEDIAASIGKIDDPIKRVQAANALFGGAGGKGIEAMAANLPDLAANLELANSSFAKGTALQNEFATAMDSTKNQLSLLKNNLENAGAAIGDILLPYITKFVSLAVPAIQMATEGFKNLSESTKFAAVGIAVLAAVAGPVVIALGSFMFSLGIIITGLIEFVEVIGGVIGGVVALGGGLLTLLGPVSIIGGLIGAVGVAAYQIQQDLGDAKNVVEQYISDAYTWGYNLITSFGDGILSAASYIYESVLSIVNSFIGLIESFSPPKKGPLTQISVWGSKLFTAYADGFAKGDMSGIKQKAGDVMTTVRGIIDGLNNSNLTVFSDTLGTIKGVISAVGANLGKSTGNIQKWMAQATEAVGGFITGIQNGTGGSLDPISKMLGGLNKDFENLITLQAEYANQTQRLHDIESALKGINNETDKNISAILKQTGLSAEQQAAAIRQAKVQASIKTDALNAEKATLEVSSDKIKEDADRQKKLIDILSSLIFPKQAAASNNDTAQKPKKPKKPKKPPKPPDTPKFDFSPLEKGQSVVDSLKKKFDETGQSTDGFIAKMGRAKEIVDGFIAGITGKGLGSDWTKLSQDFLNGFASGQQIRTTILDFLAKIQSYEETMARVGQAFYLGFNEFISGAKDGFFGVTKSTSGLTTIQILLYNIGLAAGIAVLGISLFASAVETKIEAAIKAISGAGLADPVTKAQAVWKAFRDSVDPDGTLSAKWNKLGKALGTIVDAVGLLAGAILKLTWDNLENVATAIGKIVGFIGDSLLSVVGFAASIASLILIAAGGGDVATLANNLGLIDDSLKPYAQGLSDGAKNLGQFIRDLITDAKDSALLNTFATGITNVGTAIGRIFGATAQSKGEHGKGDAASIEKDVDNLKTIVDKIAKIIGSEINIQIQSLVGFFEGLAKGFASMAAAGSTASTIKFEDIEKAIDLIARIIGLLGSPENAEKSKTAFSGAAQWGVIFGMIGGLFTFIGSIIAPVASNGIKTLALIDDIWTGIGKWKISTAKEKMDMAIGLLKKLNGFNPFSAIGAWLTPSPETIKNITDGIDKTIDNIMYRIKIHGNGGLTGTKSKSGEGGSQTSPSNSILKSMFTFTEDQIGAVVKTAKATLSTMWSDIVKGLSTAKDFVAGTISGGKSIVNTVIKGVTDAFADKGSISKIGHSIQTVFLDGITLIKKGLATIGEYISGYVKDGITNFFALVENIATSMVALGTSVSTWVVQNITLLLAKGTEIGTQIIEGIKNLFAAGADYVAEIPTAVSTWLTTNFGKLVETGKSIAGHILDGIIKAIKDTPQAMIDAVEAMIKEVAANIFSGKSNDSSTGKASGGNVKAGFSHVIGEEGRELFIPQTNGYILNHRSTEELLKNSGKVASSQSVTNININVDARGGNAKEIANAIAEQLDVQLSRKLRMASVMYG